MHRTIIADWIEKKLNGENAKWGLMVQTSYDLRSGRRVAAGRDLGPGTPFFAFDHDYRVLLTLVLDVPYSVVSEKVRISFENRMR